MFFIRFWPGGMQRGFFQEGKKNKKEVKKCRQVIFPGLVCAQLVLK